MSDFFNPDSCKYFKTTKSENVSQWIPPLEHWDLRLFRIENLHSFFDRANSRIDDDDDDDDDLTTDEEQAAAGDVDVDDAVVVDDNVDCVEVALCETLWLTRLVAKSVLAAVLFSVCCCLWFGCWYGWAECFFSALFPLAAAGPAAGAAGAEEKGPKYLSFSIINATGESGKYKK